MMDKDFKSLIENLSEGIVIMDPDRRILYLNNKAIEITGWHEKETVPYCSYCQLRYVPDGEERCILANDNHLASFRSHMPNYVDSDIDFEMSMNKLELDGQMCQVLLIRNPSIHHSEEEVKMKELLIRDTMQAQESERKRIAMELHDHIGQSVYSIYLGLDSINRHIQDPVYHERLEKMNVIMEDTLESLKRLTKELRPRLFDNLGFETALRSAVEDWRKLYKVDFSLKMNLHNTIHFKQDEGLHLFRIIQESINNAIRHGKAKHIDIEIYNIDNELYFQIVDNGTGFDITSIEGNGVGLKHMRERVKMLNGDIKWMSRKDGPTRIEGYIKL